MNAEKMRSAMDNFVNGNKKDFRIQVERFKKFEVVDLILYVEEYYTEDVNIQEFKLLLREYLKR